MNKLADTLFQVGLSWANGDAYVPEESEADAITELVALGLVARYRRGAYRTTAKGESAWGWLKTDAEVRAHGVEVSGE